MAGKDEVNRATKKRPGDRGVPLGGTTVKVEEDDRNPRVVPVGVGDSGFTDQNFRRGTRRMTAYGMGLDPTQTTERNLRTEVIGRTKSANARQYLEDRQNEDSTRFQRRKAKLDAITTSNQKRYDDENYKGRKFSTRRGWENLGNTAGRETDESVKSYTRDSDGYKKAWGDLSSRMAKLSAYYGKNGNMGGRQKEFEEVSKLINDTHNGRGLSQAQMEAASKKMDSYLGSINQKLEYGNRATRYYEKRALERQRQDLGDSAGMLSDEQVKKLSGEKRWNNIKEAMSAYDKTRALKDADPASPGGYLNSTASGRFDAMEAMQKNGISLTQMARMAVQSGKGDWFNRYDEILRKGGDTTAAIENLGYDYLSSMLKNGSTDDVDAAIRDANTVTGKPKQTTDPNQLLSWDTMGGDAPVEPKSGSPAVQPVEPKTVPVTGSQASRSPRDAASEVVGSLEPSVAQGAAKGVYGPTEAKAQALNAAKAQTNVVDAVNAQQDAPLTPVQALGSQTVPSGAASAEQVAQRVAGSAVINGTQAPVGDADGEKKKKEEQH